MRLFKLIISLPENKARAVRYIFFQLSVFVSAQHESSDFSVDVFFCFAGQAIQIGLINVSDQKQINYSSIFPFGIISPYKDCLLQASQSVDN